MSMNQDTGIVDEEDDEFEDEEDEEVRDVERVRDLREKLKTANKRAKRADELEQENRTLKEEKVLRDAGLDNLTEKQAKALLNTHDGELNKEAILATAVDLGFAEAPEPDTAPEHLEAEDRIANASAGAKSPGGSSNLTPAIVDTWPMDKVLRFKNKYPEEFEALKRGEEVRGVVF